MIPTILLTIEFLVNQNLFSWITINSKSIFFKFKMLYNCIRSIFVMNFNNAFIWIISSSRMACCVFVVSIVINRITYSNSCNNLVIYLIVTLHIFDIFVRTIGNSTKEISSIYFIFLDCFPMSMWNIFQERTFIYIIIF